MKERIHYNAEHDRINAIRFLDEKYAFQKYFMLHNFMLHKCIKVLTNVRSLVLQYQY